MRTVHACKPAAAYCNSQQPMNGLPSSCRKPLKDQCSSKQDCGHAHVCACIVQAGDQNCLTPAVHNHIVRGALLHYTGVLSVCFEWRQPAAGMLKSTPNNPRHLPTMHEVNICLQIYLPEWQSRILTLAIVSHVHSSSLMLYSWMQRWQIGPPLHISQGSVSHLAPYLIGLHIS